MQRRHLVGAIVGLAGLVLAAFQVSHGLQQTDSAVVFALDAFPFALVALSLTYVGYWLATTREFEADLERIGLWGVGGAVLFAAVAALQLFAQNVALGTLDRAVFVAADHVTVGVVVGVTVGLYDARSRQRYRDLAVERDRVEAFANTAADVNNYGRELTRSDSLAEVSALCVQAMQVLLGISRTAVLVVGDEVRAVEDTLDMPDADAERLAERARDQARSDVVVRKDPPAAVDEDADVLSVNVGEADGGTVVLLAVAGPGTTLSETDVQLTEMLLAHAATAIAGSDSPARATP